MERILIAVFDTKQQMEAACSALREREIPSDRVKVRSGVVDEQLKSELVGDDHDANDTGFFSRLFGGLTKGNERSGEYQEAVRRGGSVVIVEGIEDDRIGEAVDILEQNGAYDIDEPITSVWSAAESATVTLERPLRAGDVAFALTSEIVGSVEILSHRAVPVLEAGMPVYSISRAPGVVRRGDPVGA